MEDTDILKNKKILIVDDEPDILETLEELLSDCSVDPASNFESAKELLQAKQYDVAILDIMGVNGYDLLEIATEKGIPALMLTAYALSPDNVARSIRNGAAAFVPKEKMSDIEIFVRDILIAKERGSKRQGAWFARLRPYFYKKFGYDWREKIEDFHVDMERVDLILVPTDFSLYSCDAFVWAAFFAKKFDAKVVLLHVIRERDADEMLMVPGNPWEVVLEKEDKQMIKDFSACLIGDFHKGLDKETLVEVGVPHEKIIEVARKREASMIVMSTHGKGGLSSAFMGSVPQKVLKGAPCPVFTVKPR